MRPTTGFLVGLGLCAALVTPSAGRGPADPSGASPDPGLAAQGRELFQIYCVNCHGKDATGNGPTAQHLRVPPANLTRLRVDDVFPAERVYQVIDGRTETKGHGRTGMPIWGLDFQDPGRDTDQEAEVRARIERLVAYLESIQK